MAEAEGSKKEEKTGTGKWWEFYFVRYALGTVFGVLIVNFLVQNGVAIPFPEGNVNEITKGAGAPLLITYGLAYGYLASAPILLFHATRFEMPRTGFRGSTMWLTLISAVLATGWGLYARDSGRKPAEGLFLVAVVTIFMLILFTLSQVRALVTGFKKTPEMWDYYLKLDRNRRIKENKELVDSYRHLREHGNAFFVVLLEILLGLGLYISGKISLIPPGLIKACEISGSQCEPTSSTAIIQTLVLVLIWIIPGAAVWAIGCHLEYEFAHDTTIGKSDQLSPSSTPTQSPSSVTETVNTLKKGSQRRVNPGS